MSPPRTRRDQPITTTTTEALRVPDALVEYGRTARQPSPEARAMAAQLLPILAAVGRHSCTPEGRKSVNKLMDAVCGLKTRRHVERLSMLVEPALVERIADHVEACGCQYRFETSALANTTAHLRGLTEKMSYMESMGDGTPAVYRGQLGVDVAAMWRLATEKLYQNNDLIALATREAMQNGVDAVRMAYRSRGPHKLSAGQGYFAVSWEYTGVDAQGNRTGTLTFEDNGLGMDQNTLVTKFLVLGGSGKGEESGGDVVGGFGMAKAVILGVTPTGNWEIHSRDRGVRPVPGTMEYDVFEMPYRQGTKIVLHDIPGEQIWSQLYESWMEPTDRIRNVLAFSDVTDLRLIYDDNPVAPAFARKRGSYLDFGSDRGTDWGYGNEVTVKSYRRPPGSGTGNFYVRLGGLFQFSDSPQAIPVDIVVDITSTNRPQDRQYPLNASRDAWNSHSSAYGVFRDMKRQIEREYTSATVEQEWVTLLPDSENERERDAADAFADEIRASLEDPEFKATIASLLGGIADFYAEQEHKPAKGDGVPDTASVPGTPGEQDPYAGFRDLSDIMPKSVSTPEDRRLAGQVVADFTARTTTDGQVPWWAADVVGALARGEAPDPYDAQTFLDHVEVAVDGASDGVSGTETGGILGRILADEIGGLVAQAAEQAPGASEYAKASLKQKREKKNPFGSAGTVKISNKNYEKRDARRFLKNARKHMPMLVLWDMVLRLVAREGRVTIPFRPGFVLDNTVRGLSSTEGTPGTRAFRNFVLLQPDKAEEAVRAHKDRPWAIASYLHHIAAHELAHLPTMGRGHDEQWAIQREDLGVATAHLLPAIEQLVVNGLKLKPTLAPHVKRQLTQAKREATMAARDRVRERLEEMGRKVREAEGREKLALQENARLANVIDTTFRDRTSDTLARLVALAEYHEFREYMRGPGAPLLPPGVSTADFLAALDEGAPVVAEYLLNEVRRRGLTS